MGFGPVAGARALDARHQRLRPPSGDTGRRQAASLFPQPTAYTTRATVVNPRFNCWYDAQGNDGDDICLWSPPPFLDNGAPTPWSNLAGGCVKWR
jgi:hypothetical protein